MKNILTEAEVALLIAIMGIPREDGSCWFPISGTGGADAVADSYYCLNYGKIPRESAKKAEKRPSIKQLSLFP